MSKMGKIKGSMKKAQEALKKEIEKYEKLGMTFVKVGLPDDRVHNPSGMPLSKLGAIHEFGLGNVPERSFLRGSVRKNKDEIKKNLITIAKNVKNGSNESDQMEAFAQWGAGMVQEYISQGIDPPNTQATKMAKARRATKSQRPSTEKGRKKLAEKRAGIAAKDTPLIDTGELRQGIIGIVVND